MVVFRIEREKYLSGTLLGIGASLSSGFRWNSLHQRMVYTAESRALATLEVAVHLDLNEDLPSDRMMVEIHIPDDIAIQRLRMEDLPPGWDQHPPAVFSQMAGDDFLRSREAAVLQVPSSIIRKENNFLINPTHPDAARITVVESYPFHFDHRLSKTSQPI